MTVQTEDMPGWNSIMETGGLTGTAGTEYMTDTAGIWTGGIITGDRTVSTITVIMTGAVHTGTMTGMKSVSVIPLSV